MKFREIIEIVEGDIIHDAGNLDTEIVICCSSDLMSDILTLDNENAAMLVTGLANVQVLRTAEMADIAHIVVVREKQIAPDMIRLANKEGITLIHVYRLRAVVQRRT